MKTNMKLNLLKASLEESKSEVAVVFAVSRTEETGSKKTKSALVTGLSKTLQSRVEQFIEKNDFQGGANDTLVFREAELGMARHLVLCGLGDEKKISTDVLRNSAANALTAIKSLKAQSVAVSLDTLPNSQINAEDITQALTEGFLLAGYSFSEFKSSGKDDKGISIHLLTPNKSKAFEAGVAAGQIISDCVNFTRWLGDRPGNLMNPTILAQETMKAAKGTKLKVSAWDKAKIKSEKMGSFLSVSLGSSQEPRFIAMEYKGAPASKKPLCLVGKGLTFDSGGISIKPSAGMEEMKFDMCGGAAVIGAMLAIARLKLKINAIAFVPATENMPGPAANKPGDIVIARNGKSIEVNNTDAEGRLILNDALVYACEKKPAVILDAATLTGAMVVALGNIHTGYFTRNDQLASQIEAASKVSGELVWRMPLTDFHVKDMKGSYADLSNISSAKGAGSATAAAFLEQFVDSSIPWAHFDVAGTAWHSGDRVPYNPKKGASGVLVRTFVQFAMNM